MMISFIVLFQINPKPQFIAKTKNKNEITRLHCNNKIATPTVCKKALNTDHNILFSNVKDELLNQQEFL